jgi:hypothetical protein
MGFVLSGEKKKMGEMRKGNEGSKILLHIEFSRKLKNAGLCTVSAVNCRNCAHISAVNCRKCAHISAVVCRNHAPKFPDPL